MKKLILLFMFLQTLQLAHGQFSPQVFNHFNFFKLITDQYRTYFFQLNNSFSILEDHKTGCRNYQRFGGVSVLKACHSFKQKKDLAVDLIVFTGVNAKRATIYIERKGQALTQLESHRLFEFDFSELENHKDYRLKISPKVFEYTVSSSEAKTSMFLRYRGEQHITINYQNNSSEERAVRKVKINCISCPFVANALVDVRKLDGEWVENFYLRNFIQSVTPRQYFEAQNFMSTFFIQIGVEYLSTLQSEYSWPIFNVADESAN